MRTTNIRNQKYCECSFTLKNIVTDRVTQGLGGLKSLTNGHTIVDSMSYEDLSNSCVTA